MTTIAITNQSAPEADTIAADKLIAGNAATKLWHQFTDTTGQFHVGQWASEACKLSVIYDENELCVIVEGEVELTDADGTTTRYKAPDAFVIPAGFKGTWESLTPVRKIYAAFEEN